MFIVLNWHINTLFIFLLFIFVIIKAWFKLFNQFKLSSLNSFGKRGYNYFVNNQQCSDVIVVTLCRTPKRDSKTVFTNDCYKALKRASLRAAGGGQTVEHTPQTQITDWLTVSLLRDICTRQTSYVCLSRH